MAANPSAILEALERLAPGTPFRQALERIIQQSNGALVVLGSGPEVEEISTGGFRLMGAAFTPARLAELAKMDGGIILDDGWSKILWANVHFIPSSSYPTDETGARHRTAERVARQTGKPVVAVSEDRRLATLFFDGTKIELERATVISAKVNQSLQTLDRFRRRLDEAEDRLTRLEVVDLATHRAVVTLVQRAELVRRIGHGIERDAVSLGDEGIMVRLQLFDLLRGVGHLRDLTLRDYLKPRRERAVREAVDELEAIASHELDDSLLVGKALGFSDLDEPARPRGLRILASVARLPEPVRDELARHFRDFQRLLQADIGQLEQVEGVGGARATQLRHFLDRLVDSGRGWAPDLS
ncbi:MAG: DNA integrity scanning diadenylate cyclase DisA [Acidimicrobiia bacterium]